jgi:hypothetical protein
MKKTKSQFLRFLITYIYIIPYIIPCIIPYFFLISFISLSFESSAADHSIQHFYLKNNETIIGVASKREITRIKFDANIENIQAIAGELEYMVLEKDLYLRASVDKPINFFVKLEHNLDYRFTLSVENMPSTQIFVHSNENFKPELEKTKYLSKISPELKVRISKIIELTLHPKKDIGYEIIKTDKSLRSNIKGLSLNQTGIISGEMLIASKIYITNKSNANLQIKPEDFTGGDNFAIYLSKRELMPKEKCVLIRIAQK